MIAAFFKSFPLTMKIAGGLLLLALVFGGVQTWRLSSAKAELEDKRNELATERARHAVTRASLDSLMDRMEALVEEGKATKARLSQALSEQQERSEALRSQAGRIRAAVPTPEAVERCESPSAVLEAVGL